MDVTGDLDEFSTNDKLTSLFNHSANHLQAIVSSVDNKSLLALYGYYKQATEGPCSTPRPSWYDSKGRAKWDAWKKLDNMTQDKAKTLYAEMVKKLDPNFRVVGHAAVEEKTGWVTVSTMKPEEQVLSEAEKTLCDFVKEGSCEQVQSILQSSDDHILIANKVKILRDYPKLENIRVALSDLPTNMFYR